MPTGSNSASSSSTSVSLIERAKSHDHDAWNRLGRLYSPLVLYWCSKAGLRTQDAEDIVQEVLRAVFRKIGDFQHNKPEDTFRGWLRTITVNKVRDRYRKLGKLPTLLGDGDGELRASTDESVDEATERHVVLHRALDMIRPEFKEATWQAFWRTTVESQPDDVVANALGTSLNAVYIAKSRVLKRLRTEFKGLAE